MRCGLLPTIFKSSTGLFLLDGVAGVEEDFKVPLTAGVVDIDL